MKKGRARKVEKPWGYELIFAQKGKYMGKVIVVNKGKRLSLHYHDDREETLFLSRGIAKVSVQGRTMTLRPGESIHILPKVRHRIEAIEDCQLFEVSTPEVSPPVRLEDDYDRTQQPSFAVFMAGGEGVRLWPLSRKARPKHLLNLVRGTSLIRETVDRIRGDFPVHNVFIVTQRHHFDQLFAEIPDIPQMNFILEPLARNTAACAGLAALKLEQIYPEAVVALLPADHFIEGKERFLEILNIAIQAARDTSELVLLGVKPTRMDSGYGYFQLGARHKEFNGLPVSRLTKFLEKPGIEVTEQLLKNGLCLWNSGIVVTKVSTLLNAIKLYLPDLHAGLEKIRRSLGKESEESVTEKVYKSLPTISLDYGILEKAPNVLAIPGDFGWSDLGSWAGVGELCPSVTRRQVFVDAEDCFVWSPNKLVAALGVKGLIVIETDDCIFICSKERGQDVRLLVEELEKAGLKEYL